MAKVLKLQGCNPNKMEARGLVALAKKKLLLLLYASA